MSLVQSVRQQGGHFHNYYTPSIGVNRTMNTREIAGACNYDHNNDSHAYNANFYTKNYNYSHDYSLNIRLDGPNYSCAWPDAAPSSKRRKISNFPCKSTGRPYQEQNQYENHIVNNTNQCEYAPFEYPFADRNTRPVFDDSSTVIAANRHDGVSVYTSSTSKRDRSKLEDEELVLMSKDEIERCSPSRKDGIDVVQEAHLRYSYCDFLQNLGARLDLPQTTIGTAMILCHRFFVRRSHASHDRFLIATSVLFLASKSEETPRSLNDVLRASCEIFHNQDFTLLSYMLPIDWFEQYRERITEAEHLILTTLNFELNVQHPYESLTSTLQKLGFSQSMLVNLAFCLVGEGLRSSLWLQFKPHQIAAGAAYLAAKFLNMNLASCHNVWEEFHTSPSVLKDVAYQLMELL
ncbi:cyclin-T1-3-like isoform X1 [Primulina eburnea]|uniref:cyclin-T1-3-like isoform X1 n=2 Tax=Primulina eburnea TaxID=1245227 RepID=UPI003C6C54BA